MDMLVLTVHCQGDNVGEFIYNERKKLIKKTKHVKSSKCELSCFVTIMKLLRGLYFGESRSHI